MEQVIKSLGDMEGKTIIDLSWPENELADDGFYRMTVEPSGAEVIQGWIPKAMVVKAFGTTGTNRKKLQLELLLNWDLIQLMQVLSAWRAI
jgi:predicted dinucleotide-binding enzyme